MDTRSMRYFLAIALTDDGLIFRKRAQEVIDLMDQIKNDLAPETQGITGDVRVACGETNAVTLLAQAAKVLQCEHPSVSYRLLSGDRDFVLDKLDHNAADLGLLVVSSVNSSKFDFLRLPAKDTWGVIMQENDPLAYKESVTRAYTYLCRNELHFLYPLRMN